MTGATQPSHRPVVSLKAEVPAWPPMVEFAVRYAAAWAVAEAIHLLKADDANRIWRDVRDPRIVFRDPHASESLLFRDVIPTGIAPHEQLPCAVRRLAFRQFRVAVRAVCPAHDLADACAAAHALRCSSA